MQTNEQLNMVILDDYHDFFNKMEIPKSLPSFISLTIFNDHINNEQELIKKLYDYQIIVGIRESTPALHICTNKSRAFKLLKIEIINMNFEQ